MRERSSPVSMTKDLVGEECATAPGVAVRRVYGRAEGGEEGRVRGSGEAERWVGSSIKMSSA